ncbi:MAG: FHA domain-containing protein [Myxococcales bacterium]|nr:FHA domain-containing protein [Myxococcota bacterium]MDW8280260.1 FHA domain-containing protein [Myxococcales bacterium]
MARFWIRLRATEVHLPVGEVLIGRGPECFLRIDEPTVSRRHARLLISSEEVILEDLGSRNGSFINGIRAERPQRVRAGDVITIGTQRFVLESEIAPMEHLPTGRHRVVGPQQGAGGPAPTTVEAAPLPLLSVGTSLGHCSRCGAPQGDAAICPRCGQVYRHEFSDPPTTSTGQPSAHQLFWALSDKVLAMGRLDEAERMMGPRLAELLERATAGEALPETLVAESVRRALRLAVATRSEAWLGWIFEFSRACRYRIPLVLLDELYAQIFAQRPALGSQIAAYAAMLPDDTLHLRLEALRRLCRE